MARRRTASATELRAFYLRAAAAQAAAANPAALVGQHTFPYKRPPGTKAARVLRVEGDIAHLSDGTSMHVSHFRAVAKGAVA